MSELFVLKNTGIVLFKSPSLHVCLDAGWTSSILKQIERRYYVLARRYEFYVRVPTAAKTSLKTYCCATSNLTVLIPSCLVRQMLAIFPGVEL